jgi:hypothetical protein
MRKSMLLLVLVAAAFPSPAAQRRITVAELQQFLTRQYAAQKSDGSIGESLGEMELTEQLTEPTLDRMMADFKPGTKTAHSLRLLADASAYLGPPVGEIPGNPEPEMAEQTRLIQAAVNFATVTIGKLPDFLATRTTFTFDDSVVTATQYGSGFAAFGPLHATGEYGREITYRDGREVNTEQMAGQGKWAKHDKAPPGLTSYGEFGPFLVTVLSDSDKGHLVWSHWEQTRAGMAAVFKFEVPQAASHYVLDYCCMDAAPVSELNGVIHGGNTSTPSSFHGTPGYHGYLYLDSATGAVMKVTAEAEMNGYDPITRMDTWVEYGTVDIGGRNYLCPVRSMTLSVLHPRGEGEAGLTRLNEVTFTNYHRFGSTARIVSTTPGP